MSKRLLLTIAQLGLIPVVAVGAWGASWLWFVAAIVMFYAFALVGVSVTYHRLLSHGAFRAPRWFVLLGSTLASVGFLLSPLEWTTQHHEHHKFVDVEGDPHAPRIKGFKVALYAFHGDGQPGIAAARVFKDHELMQLHRKFWLVLAGYIAATLLIGGWHGFVFLWAMPCLLTLWSGVAGVFMHGRDGARTGGIVAALVTCGEHNHKRHHEAPRDWSGDWPASWIIKAVQ